MSTVLENTLLCTYKGASLYVDRITGTGGRSKANYLYLNSGRRVSKDLGAFPKVFQVHGWTYSQDGDEYAAKRDAMQSALDSPLDGDFVHPFSGNYWCSHEKYNWTEDFSELNLCEFTFTLEQVSKDGANPLTPTGEIFNKSQIKAMALDTNRKLQTACSDSFNVSTLDNEESAVSFLQSASNKMRGTFSGIGDSLAKANAYADTVMDVNDNASYYARNPKAAFAALADGILGVDGLTADIYVKFRAVQNMFNFGNDGTDTSFAITSPIRIVESPTTFEDAERTKNANLIKTFMQGAAAAQAFSQAGASEPTTTDEIDNFLSVLEDQFDSVSALMTVDDYDETYQLGTSKPDFGEAYASMIELRSAVAGYLTQKRANAAYVKTITVQPMPCSTLAYLLYNDSSRMDEIMKLNGLTDCFDVSGELRVLSK